MFSSFKIVFGKKAVTKSGYNSAGGASNKTTFRSFRSWALMQRK